MIKLFIDTDIGPDCDDAGALQVAHTLCNRGLAELIGVTHCTGNPYGLPAVSAINRWNGRETPLGTTRRSGFLAENTRYNKPLSERFDHEFADGRPQRPAREVFEEALSRQEDGSVTLVSIGPLNNLADFISDEAGLTLVRRKVCRLVSMAGRFESEKPEWNVQMDVEAARTVLEKWPTPVVFCGWECGATVIAGRALEGKPDSPIRMAYCLWTGSDRPRRASYDPVTVFYAVMGDNPWIGASEQGTISVREDGVTVFSTDPAGRHRYTINRVCDETLAGLIDTLL